MRWFNFLGRKPAVKKPENPLFTLYDDHYTDNPRVAYAIFGYGTLPLPKNVAIHYFRLRPFLGARDPVLAEGVPDRGRLARSIISSEKDPISRGLLENLFSPYPTHVLRLGWKHKKTGQTVDLLYIALCFRHSNHSTMGLAQACGDRLVEQLQQEAYFSVLCPPPDKLRAAQMFWVAVLFIRFRWLVSDRYKID